MSIFDTIREYLNKQKAYQLFLQFYTVGILLYILPLTRPLFFTITPFTILLVVVVIFLFHRQWTPLSMGVFAFIGVSSFFLEVAGTNTGILFGTYNYDSTLGFKAWNTPLIIGINWIYLIYATQSIVSTKIKCTIGRIIGGSLLMVAYDLVLEVAAPPMQMWHFDSFYPPLLNFIMWFLASAVYHTCIVLAKIDVENSFARSLYWVQFVFFSIIGLYNLVF